MQSTEPEHIEDGLIVVPRKPGAPGQGKRAFQSRRRSRACDPCRKRKTRCETVDNGPCNSCQLASLKCVFSEDLEGEPTRRKPGHQRQIRELEATVKELKHALQETKEKLASVTGKAASPEPEAQRPHHSLDVIPSSPNSDDSRETQSSSARNISLSGGVGSYERRNSFQPSSSFRSTNHALEISASYGFSPDIIFLTGIQKWLENFGVGAASVSQGLSWQNIDTGIVPPSPPASYLKDPGVSDIRGLLPHRQVGEALLDVYRTKFQRYMPMFYWPIIQRKFNRAYDFPFDITDESSITGSFCVVMMILAIASSMTNNIDIYQGHSDYHRRGWLFYEHARKFHDLNKLNYTSDDVTVLILMTLYLHNSALSSPAWMMVGSLARVCMVVGLHRQPQAGQCPSYEVEHQSRLFWAAYLLDRHLALQFGRSPLMKDSEIDIDTPGHNGLDGIDTDSDTLSSSNEGPVPFGIQIMTHAIDDAKISELIIDLDITPGREDESHARILEIELHLEGITPTFPYSLVDVKNDDPIDPLLMRFLLLPLISSISLYNSFANPQLSFEFRSRSFTSAVQIAGQTAGLIRRMMKFENWEKGFRLYQSELVYHHTFRCAVILLLGLRLHGVLRNETTVTQTDIYNCVVALKSAAIAHPKISRSLESFHQLVVVLDNKPYHSMLPSISLRSGPAYPQNRPQDQNAIAPDLEHLPKTMNVGTNYHTYQNPGHQSITNTASTMDGPYGHAQDPDVDPHLAHIAGKMWSASSFGQSTTSASNPTFDSQPLDIDMHWSPNFSSLDWNVSGDAMQQNMNGRPPRNKQ